ncbi:bacteriohemerythrin [Clostridium sp. DJ247]|uniref:bacteriohemerythrin n=1 Tax=Clostridium sp. DJ247 TaxID=2726188 RepID=UPI00162A049F|nr:hemerythrin family protein [Clostridium sp. DJ247]MBC2582186.1 hemerythrin family protein [Clostridium sp. DJ247]
MLGWKDEYIIGVNIIDNQHKQLFEIADRAYKLLKNEFITDKYDKIVEIIDELKTYTVFHFRTEEEYMLSIGYKKYFSHRVEHDDFIKQINDFDLEKIDLNQDKNIIEILELIVNWIDKHILDNDKLIVI